MEYTLVLKIVRRENHNKLAIYYVHYNASTFNTIMSITQ